MIPPCYQCHPGNYRGYRAAVYRECRARDSCDYWREWKKWTREQQTKREKDGENDAEKQG